MDLIIYSTYGSVTGIFTEAAEAKVIQKQRSTNIQREKAVTRSQDATETMRRNHDRESRERKGRSD